MVDLSAKNRKVRRSKMLNCPSVAVIILAFNEEDNLPKMLKESVDFLDARVPEWELLVVDDGSSDNTRAVAQSFADSDERVRVLVHEQNRGMGAGMKTGIRAATAEYFTIIAGDGQHPTPELEVLLPGLAEADIVTTYHSNQREPVRRVLSFGFRRAMQWACGINFTLEGIYLFPRRVAVEEIGLDNIPGDTFFFSFELIARAVRAGYSVTVRPMIVRPREHGVSKVATTRRIRRIAGEIYGFRERLKAEA
jgi:glycosyltransferase involved in cell wall biosynthesis